MRLLYYFLSALQFSCPYTYRIIQLHKRMTSSPSRVPCIATMSTLYIKLPAQVYAALQSPQSRGNGLGRRRVGSGTVEGGRAAIEWGQAITIYRTAGKDWDVWGIRQEKSRVELAESDEKDTASGREFVGVHVFYEGDTGEGRGVSQKSGGCPFWYPQHPNHMQWLH